MTQLDLFARPGRWRVQCTHNKTDRRTGEVFRWYHGPTDWGTAQKLASISGARGVAAVVEAS